MTASAFFPYSVALRIVLSSYLEITFGFGTSARSANIKVRKEDESNPGIVKVKFKLLASLPPKRSLST